MLGIEDDTCRHIGQGPLLCAPVGFDEGTMGTKNEKGCGPIHMWFVRRQ
jgi:hypothetical protein